LVTQQRRGTLKVSKTNVAKEAGRSRTKLYECTKVLERIDALTRQPRSASNVKIANLRAQNDQLRKERQAAVDLAAALLLRMRSIERMADQTVRRRRRQPQHEESNHRGAKVIRFPGGSDEPI